MKTPNQTIPFTVSPAAIDAVMRQAQEERAEYMREVLAGMLASAKTLAARLRPPSPGAVAG